MPRKILALVLLPGFFACNNTIAEVQLLLPTQADALSESLPPISLPSGGAGLGRVSFTPISLRVPVKSVALVGDSGMQPILSCSDSDEACLIDFASQKSLDEAAASVAVNPGTYRRAQFSLCGPEEGGPGKTPVKTLFVKGSFEKDNVTWYTTSTSDVVTDDPTKWSETGVSVQTCQLDMTFSRPLEIVAGETVKLTLFPIVGGTAFALTQETSASNAMCKSGPQKAICLNLPNLIPYAGAGKAFLESYAIADQGENLEKAGGLVQLLVDESGQSFGGMTLVYFRASSERAFAPFGQAIRTIAANSDGSYAFSTYGSNPSQDVYGYLNFPTFSRLAKVGETRDGAYRTSVNGQALDEPPVPYTAIRVSPAEL